MRREVHRFIWLHCRTYRASRNSANSNCSVAASMLPPRSAGWALKPCGKQMLASIQAARPVALCFRAIAAALLTSALLLEVRWDTLRFVVQIIAQSRLSKPKAPRSQRPLGPVPRLGERLTAKRASALPLRTRSNANQAWKSWRPPRTLGGHCVCGRRSTVWPPWFATQKAATVLSATSRGGGAVSKTPARSRRACLIRLLSAPYWRR